MHGMVLFVYRAKVQWPLIPQPGLSRRTHRKPFIHLGHLQGVEMEDTQARGLIVFF